MYYHDSIKEVEKKFNTNLECGLNTAQVQQKTHPTFKNQLEEKKRKSWFLVFLSQLTDPLIYILGVAFIISLLLKEVVDAFIILSVVILNAIIGSVEECKAEKALEELKKMSAPHCLVKRNQKVIEIPAKDLVMGDLVLLETGRTIPADLRLTKTMNLKIDESSLTGESVPVEKDANLCLKPNTALGDQKNMAFMSTNVAYGKGEGIVTHIGMNTQIGKIAKMLSDEKDTLTPLQKKLGELGKVLGMIAISICFLLLIVALIQKRNVIEMLITSISLAVAAIPEGLPAVVTIVLSMGVQKMVKVNTIVRKLHSVETLGAVNIICSDKTGTLTQNKMTVIQAYQNQKQYPDLNTQELSFLALGMSLCNDAFYEKNQYLGDPTEIALLVMAKNLKIDKDEMDKIYPRMQELPFDSRRKMMSTLHQMKGQTIQFCKGALDQLILRCSHQKVRDIILPLNEKEKKEILMQGEKMARQSMRVLALAYKPTSQIEEKNLIFVGMVGMIDPPRKEAIQAIQDLKEAGIETIMITGDHKNTAFAIAKELDIVQNETECISGAELDKLNEKELARQIQQYRVFSRVTPEHKVKIVKALKENENIVAMTGDGVNDAPSLKAADIGIAMGISGTDVAKGAADMVLSDDNFASIEKAVKEGRGIYANIKKSLLFLLSSNIGEILTMFLGVLLNLPIPLLAIHILWVNLLTDSFPALALGQDDNGDTLMHQKPRNAKESLFAHGGMKILILYGLIIGLVSLSAYMIVPIYHLMQQHIPITYVNILQILKDPLILKKAQTYAFCTLALSQLFHSIGMKNMENSAFDKRLFQNKLLILSFLLGYLIQILVTEVPFLSQAFKTTHLAFSDWIIITFFSMIPLVVHELLAWIKKIKRKQKLS